MAFSGIANVTTSVASLVHDQYRDNFVSAFGDIEEMKLFDMFKTDISGSPATTETFKVLTKRPFNSVLPANPSSRALPVGKDAGWVEGKYRTKEYRAALEFGVNELKYLDAGMRSGADLSHGSYIDASDYVSAIVEGQAQTQVYKVLVDLFSDGTGVVGVVSAIDDANIATGRLVLTLNDSYNVRGSCNLMREGAILVAASNDATLATFTGATNTDGLEIVSVDYELNKIHVDMINSAGAVQSGGSATSVAAGFNLYFGTKALAAGGSIQIPDLSAAITEYDTLTDHILGLRALVRDDGAVVQGLTRSGLLASMIKDCGGAALRPTHLSALITKISRRWNSMSRFKFDSFICANEVISYLIESAMSDRRLVGDSSGVPAAFGSTTFGFKEPISGRETSWNFTHSQFVPTQDIYLLPKGMGDVRPLSLPYSEMEDAFEGSESVAGLRGFMAKPASGSYELAVLKYETMRLGFFSKMPSALGKVTNFALT